MTLSRRGFLGALASAVAAPYVVRASGVLMPVANRLVPPQKVWTPPTYSGSAIGLARIREQLMPGLMAITAQYDELPHTWKEVFSRKK